MTDTDGLRDYCVPILPKVSRGDLNWDARQVLGWMWKQQQDKVSREIVQ